MAYAELACGHGFGTALLAAANPDIDFYGFDFNPAQISNAKRFVAESKLDNAFFFDQSFEESSSASADAFPKFDIIVLHGIYSWISAKNRDHIVRFLRDRLSPGGLVYVSYNCMPGWAAASPLQRLLREHANRHPDRSDRQVRSASAFAEQLSAGGAQYFLANPGVTERISKFSDLNQNYLAHEYLNGHWHPLYFLDVEQELEQARLSFACSATISEGIDAVNLPQGLQKLTGHITDRAWLETIRDFAANRQFRRDIFMRGLPVMNELEQHATLGDVIIQITARHEGDEFKFSGPLGEIIGNSNIYPSLYNTLSIGPKSLNEISQLEMFRGKPFQTVLQAVLLLVHANLAMPQRRKLEPLAAPDSAARFNRVVAERLRSGEALGFFAAPAVGTGIVATYVEQVICLAVFETPDMPIERITGFAWDIMRKTGRRLLKDGRTLESADDNLAELAVQLATFMSQKAPMWRQLGILQ